jgi:hypothetical protein
MELTKIFAPASEPALWYHIGERFCEGWDPETKSWSLPPGHKSEPTAHEEATGESAYIAWGLILIATGRRTAPRYPGVFSNSGSPMLVAQPAQLH